MKIGILGGTFNPPHNGHLRHAIEVGEALGLERVLLTPCAEPPHKPGSCLLPFELRVRLLRSAVRRLPLLEVSTHEEEMDGPSYTFFSLQEWHRRQGIVSRPDGFVASEQRPFFMMGAESFAALDSWFRGTELPRFAHLVMVPRSGKDGRVFCEAVRRFWPGSLPDEEEEPCQRKTVELRSGGSCTFLPVPRMDVSSTFIRARWLEGRSVAGLVPESVLSVLEEEREVVTRCWSA